MSNWYDDPEAIERILHAEGLPGMLRVWQERHVAGYERGERMIRFVVLGRFVFDSGGNLGRITTPLFDEENDPRDFTDRCGCVLGARIVCVKHCGGHGIPSPQKLRPPTVVAMDQMMRPVGWTPGQLPTLEDRCASCGEGWTLETMHDLVERRNGDLRHAHCNRMLVVLKETEIFRQILANAQIPVNDMFAIPNRYWSSEDAPPWFRVITPKGAIVLGWRKRVICLDWSRSAIEVGGVDVVKDERITHGPRMCHCYGDEECTAALIRLRERVESAGGWT